MQDQILKKMLWCGLSNDIVISKTELHISHTNHYLIMFITGQSAYQSKMLTSIILVVQVNPNILQFPNMSSKIIKETPILYFCGCTMLSGYHVNIIRKIHQWKSR